MGVMLDPNAHVLLLTGTPGVGKTTLISKVVAKLDRSRLAGFYTEEIRVHGERKGFQLVTFDGRERLLAHVELPKTHRVGRYGVDVAAVEAVAESALALEGDVDVYIVDEIGKMECKAPGFIRCMRLLLSSKRPVVATVSRSGLGFIDEVKRRTDVDLWEVTPGNRDELPVAVLEWLAPRIGGTSIQSG